ncbi:Uncharacterized protein YydD, contains DUF2326 domain [Pseudonocardia ammonioxydans]|uniref:Uncharacterized protein YydD, contains DUF2326 domain n=1 Tax=Pseudonocardia ammonioxydans TaxID=260086 RepID=A0A1I5GPK3_PSUAM|nr:ABC-three component system protein [Pseudonocardia ammonioxydans]SFO37850.1 Uncharacterized protein YydD, contains DUF2326 domain [Pseudonocardia ammonioxydans]
MLHELSSNLPDFKTARFEPGVNIALAIRTRSTASKDSRNAVGKSSMLRVLDFLFGSDARSPHVLRNVALEKSTYELLLDLGENRSNVRRSIAEMKFVEVNDGSGPVSLPNAEWRVLLGQELFGLTGSELEPSFRSLLSYYLRDVGSGAYAGRPIETFRKQRAMDTQRPLAYLFGLDLELVAAARNVAEASRSAAELRRAARDPIMGMTLGRSAEIDAEVRTLDIRRRQLEVQVSDFRVVEQYSQHRRRADELSREIRLLNDEIYTQERRIADIRASLEDENREQPDHDYVTRVFQEVGRELPQLVERRLEEVHEFHQSVIRNRRRYLENERDTAIQLRDRATSRLVAADEERASTMRLLQEGGALETFLQLQEQLSDVNGRLSELRQRQSVVDRWENSSRHLQLEAAKLEIDISTDVQERSEDLESIARIFSDFAYEIYGSDRPASLVIEPSKSGYSISPTIGGDQSQGVRSIVMFCFDLTLAVVAKRRGRGPDFLVHDSHLYDAVEARQVASALRLANEVTEREGMQYIATLNSDALERAQAEGINFDFHQCTELTDEYESGGLFGLRFN